MSVLCHRISTVKAKRYDGVPLFVQFVQDLFYIFLMYKCLILNALRTCSQLFQFETIFLSRFLDCTF
jgi:hypothetical protein